MTAPNFSQRSWAEVVQAHEPEYFKTPLVYEFGRERKFYKNDTQWYASAFVTPITFGTEQLTFGDEELEF